MAFEVKFSGNKLLVFTTNEVKYEQHQTEYTMVTRIVLAHDDQSLSVESLMHDFTSRCSVKVHSFETC